jgi:hypothetical protein
MIQQLPIRREIVGPLEHKFHNNHDLLSIKLIEYICNRLNVPSRGIFRDSIIKEIMDTIIYYIYL